jgi:succinate dehydrogenase hydrophobic anchor subunit
MRKVNTILSVLLIVIFMIHGIMGSFMLLGVGASAGKILAWIGVAILAAHMVIGVLLTVQTFKASKAGGKSYLKQNELFWTRRASGLAILIMMFFHIGLFGKMQDGEYILLPFTSVKLIAQLLLIAALFLHIFVNIRPLLVSMGVISFKERRIDIFLILAVLLLFMSGAVVFYYIGWKLL